MSHCVMFGDKSLMALKNIANFNSIKYCFTGTKVSEYHKNRLKCYYLYFSFFI